MVSRNNIKKNKVIHSNTKIELLYSKLITKEYPLKSLQRAFSKISINEIQDLSEMNIINIYENWRNYEAILRKNLRRGYKRNKKQSDMNTSDELNIWSDSEFSILSEFSLFNEMGIP